MEFRDELVVGAMSWVPAPYQPVTTALPPDKNDSVVTVVPPKVDGAGLEVGDVLEVVTKYVPAEAAVPTSNAAMMAMARSTMSPQIMTSLCQNRGGRAAAQALIWKQ